MKRCCDCWVTIVMEKWKRVENRCGMNTMTSQISVTLNCGWAADGYMEEWFLGGFHDDSTAVLETENATIFHALARQGANKSAL